MSNVSISLDTGDISLDAGAQEERPEVILAMAELASNPANPSAVRVIDRAGKQILEIKRDASPSEVLGPPSVLRVREETSGERMLRRFSEAKSEISNLLLRLRSAGDIYARDGMTRRLLDRISEAKHVLQSLTPSQNG